jgi:hypothetical protein
MRPIHPSLPQVTEPSGSEVLPHVVREVNKHSRDLFNAPLASNGPEDVLEINCISPAT